MSVFNIKKGQMVELRDKQTIDQIKEKTGKLVNGDFYEVLDVKTLRSENVELMTKIAYLSNDLRLILRGVDDEEWYAILAFIPEDFKPGNRKDVIESGGQYIFQEPKIENWKYNDLEHASVMNDEETSYISLHGTIYGECDEDRKMFGFTHLKAEKDIDNPEAIIVEYGDSDFGGYCEFYLGVILAENELEILE